MNKTPLIYWKADYNVGIQDIDNDHRQLVKMINRLFGSVLSSDPADVVNSVLKDLLAYVVFHFNRELALMEKYGYPEREQHNNEHRLLLESASQFKKRFDSGLAINIKEEIEVSLRDWLVNHVRNSDKRLGHFLLLRNNELS
ncbi:MAG: bacteriohemerythrin [Magnetococcus sp. DMHC-6]